jgi:NAD(P)-dependent dehydrogenase (short-subunit alcohol dehydrogenase family)
MATPFDLTGKVAVVTGATRGIGRAIAYALAEAGANVVVVSRSQSDCRQVADELARTGAGTLAVAADLASLPAIEHMVAAAVAAFGQLDILVNNAGNAVTKRAEDITEADWDRVLGLDLKGVFFACQAAGRQMISQRQGKIINVASILGQVGERQVSPYCAAKGGVIQLTRALALEWARHNIQVNALCPGYVETSINAAELQDEKVRRYITGKTAAGRLGQPADMAGAALFLASPAADYMTGQTLTIDGGWTAQ